MIDLYYWTTPNGHKMTMFLEETGMPYTIQPVNIGKGDQFKPEFLAISPNNRMPAIVDHDEPDGPLPVFESGAILIHLAEKTGRFMPAGKRVRKEMLEWLFWQVGNLGPMAGQLSHFVNYAQGEHPYSHQRYADEYNRCLGVLERRLEGRARDSLEANRHRLAAYEGLCEELVHPCNLLAVRYYTAVAG
jgi:GST-like protein